MSRPQPRDRIGAVRRSYVSYADMSLGLEAALHPDARRYDAPVIASSTLAAALAADQVLEAAGWDAVFERARLLAGRLADALRERGHEVIPRGPTTLVAWRVPEDAAEAEVGRLAQAGVVVRWLPGRGEAQVMESPQ